MPEALSCEIEPTIRLGTDSLKELLAFGTTVTTELSVIGMSATPRLRKGWPKAYMRWPSRNVTVPEAATEKSPRTSCTLTEVPGASVLSLEGASGVMAAAPPTPETGKRPLA